VPPKHIDTINEYTRRIAVELKVCGLMNIQYAIANDTVYILEANPRASRTVPLVSKVCNIPMAAIATELMLGKKLKDMNLVHKHIPHYGVKEAVFPFNMFPEVDPVLGPEMRSTGEVLGMADTFGMAYFKAQEATQMRLPVEGTVLITVAEPDKPAVLAAARLLSELKFRIYATSGTAAFLKENNIACESVLKMHEGRPHLVDNIKNGEIHLIINTPSGKRSQNDDSYIRKAAIKYKIPYITTTAAAIAAARGIADKIKGASDVKSLQDYHADIK
jgi:carbamoyl-phosphate synthase large subunit